VGWLQQGLSILITMAGFSASIVVLSCLGLAAGQTPLLGWSATGGVFTHKDSIRAGSTLTLADATTHFSNVFAASSTVVVFAQDKVTTADFARYSGTPAFAYLKTAVASSKDVLVLPSIEQSSLSVASDLVAQLRAQLPADGEVLDVVAADWESTANRVKATGAPQLVVVRMPEVAASADAAKSLQSNDNTMSRVMQDLSSRPVVAFFTGDFGDEPALAASLRSRRNKDAASSIAQMNATSRPPAPLSRHTCKQWPQQPEDFLGHRQTGGGTCRQRSKVWGEKSKTMMFGTSMLMGLTVGALMVVVFISGTFGLMVLQTNSKFPSVDDIPIIVSTANE